ncbi:MAG: hypothetical protein COA99_04160 [Moraxellaceae bacterium]|nr:MAG: hypothetical protein COA99_04160 [Moraxellaceae bacterium]
MGDSVNSILIIDDEEDDVEIIKDMLSDTFAVETCLFPETAVDCINQTSPAVILLNPGMANLEIIPIIKAAKSLNPPSHIIFLSNLTSLEDSITAYEQGADDFISKPYNPIELFHKISNSVDTAAERNKLIASAELARATAFTAMESNSEMGVILRYMEEITSCNSYNDLGLSLAQTVLTLGANVILQIRGINKVVNFGCADNSFEAHLLSKSLKKGKLIEGVHKFIINDQRISILVTNTPNKEDPKYGRLKDNLAMMLGVTDARITTIDLVILLADKRKSGLQSVTANTSESMLEIRDTFNTYEKNIWQKIIDYREHTDGIIMTLGLSEEQEITLIDALDQFVESITETEATKHLIESSFKEMLYQLDQLDSSH